MQVRTFSFAAALAATALTPFAAMAQSADRAADRFDTRMNNRPVAAAPIVASTPSLTMGNTMQAMLPRGSYMALKGAGKEEAEGEDKPVVTLDFGLSVPFAYSSNPEQASTGKEGDWHFDPGLELAITRATKRGILTLGASVDTDIYLDRPANDTATLLGSVNYDVKTDRLGGAVPFLNYTVAELYAGQFDDHAVTLHEFAAGANLRRELPLPAKPAPGATPMTLSVGGSVTRREASSAAANQNRIRGVIGLSGKWGEVGWSFSQAAAYKDYTAGANSGREDVTFTTKAAINGEFAGLSLSLGAQLDRNVSSKAGSDYTVWNVGPTISRAF